MIRGRDSIVAASASEVIVTMLGWMGVGRDRLIPPSRSAGAKAAAWWQRKRCSNPLRREVSWGTMGVDSSDGGIRRSRPTCSGPIRQLHSLALAATVAWGALGTNSTALAADAGDTPAQDVATGTMSRGWDLIAAAGASAVIVTMLGWMGVGRDRLIPPSRGAGAEAASWWRRKKCSNPLRREVSGSTMGVDSSDGGIRRSRPTCRFRPIRQLRSLALAATVAWGAWGTNPTALAADAGDTPVREVTTGLMPHPSFEWAAVPEASGYEVELATDAAFSRILVRDTIEVPRFVPMPALRPGTVFWRTRSRDRAGHPGAWSEPNEYHVVAPAQTYDVPASATLAQIQEIVATAVAHPPARVTFAAGATYRFKPEHEVLRLQAAHDLILEGNGATVIIEEPSAGFIALERCQHVTVSGFTIDYDPLPHSVGEVKAVERSGGKVVLALEPEPGYPAFDAPHMLAHWSFSVLLDSDPARRGWMKPNADLVLNLDGKHVERVPGTAQFRVPLVSASTASQYAPGDRVIVFARQHGQSVAGSQDCTDITFADMTVYACPGGHFIFLRGSELKVLGCHEQRKDATRWYAGNADGVHVRASLKGPWIEGCTFQAIGDDGIALYNKGIAVVAQLGPDRVRVAGTFMDLRVGDRFALWNPRDGLLIGGDRTVASVERTGATYELTFSPALAPEVKLQAVAGDAPHSDQLFNRSARNAGFVVRRNSFEAIRRYGTVFRSTDGLVADNTYRGTSNAAVTNVNEPTFWHNGLESDRVLITRNIITACGFDGSARGRASIDITLNRLGGLAAAPLNRSIVIAENRVTDWSQRAISLQNALASEIRQNVIGSARSDFLVPGGDNHAIFLRQTDACRVLGNDLSNERRTLDGAITIRESGPTTSEDNRLPATSSHP